jgi:hypothetical protein
MVKFFLLVVLAFGAFCAFSIFAPSSWGTAFRVSGHAIPWIALGVCAIGWVGYKAIK